ncbi:hypothetical protein LSH36_188g05025 [Paralvinella palmiformis]|uniref:Ubiquitin-like domain-containing protein n=1 Tax=Paralvinella palmiformis TaxID=53620 RepID=A0AAD9N6S6_9ANNE|nr:hypothetical protein LSH36_188g05025 [Paralvinella palmiformis]
MRVHIKILKGDGCIVDVKEQDKVLCIKEKVELQLNVPVVAQRLVHRGKPLSDEWTLKQCGVKDGTKLFLVVKKEEELGSTSQTSRLNFWDEMHYFLLKHYRQGDAKQILEHFTKDFQRSINSLSLDDIERIASLKLKQEDT